MSTTPNYSWPLIEPTDFVTNLPADLETLADAIDDTVKDLNPGTTAGDVDYYTSATAKVRLGIGTVGQVLTVNAGATAPEWQTPVAGGMVQLASGSLSGSSVNLTSISGTYKHLQLIIRNFDPATDGARINFRFNNDSTANRYYSGAYVDFEGAFNGSGIGGTSNQDNGTSTALMIITIYDYANTTTMKMADVIHFGNNETTPTNLSYLARRGFWNQTSAINEINLFTSTGNFAGTYILYGVN